MLGMVIGTRPELIKLTPIYRQLCARRIPTQIIFTRQHSGLRSILVEEALKGRFPLAEAETYADVLQTAHNLRMTPHAVPCKAIIVQGDTNSAAAAALAAAYDRIPVIHVEAGLRTYADEPYPEELNRQLISRIASMHLAPTPFNAQNLRLEQVKGRIVQTGNPGITVVANWLNEVDLDRAKLPERQIIVTCHRRENWARIALLIDELLALSTLTQLPIHFVLHPNPELQAAARSRIPYSEKQGPSSWGRPLFLWPPTTHAVLLSMMARAALIITDSGGIVEEATFLGKKLCVLRKQTERHEASAHYTEIKPGCHTTMLAALDPKTERPAAAYNTFGDENSATNCVDAIEVFYKELTK